MHCYIKHQDEEGKWWNLEATTGSFSRSSFIMHTFNVNEYAIKSGLFMKGLDKVESVAYCLNDLLTFYEWKTGRYSDEFVRDCYTLGLRYYPVSQLLVWKLNDLQFQIRNAMIERDIKSNIEILNHPDLYELYIYFDFTKRTIHDIGYSTIRDDDYERMVNDLFERQKQSE